MGQAAIQAGVPVDVRQETPSSLSFQASIAFLVLHDITPLYHPLQGSNLLTGIWFKGSIVTQSAHKADIHAYKMSAICLQQIKNLCFA